MGPFFVENSGTAYLFDGVTGARLLTFSNPTAGIDDKFGASVAAVGNNVLVGAEATRAGGAAAYLFDGVSGGLLQTYLNPTPAAFDNFGFSVAAVGNNVLVGAPFDNIGVGAAYLLDGTTAPSCTFVNPTPGVDDNFGFSVAAVGNNVLVGACRLTTTMVSLMPGRHTCSTAQPVRCCIQSQAI